jgi:hypothetical protein
MSSKHYEESGYWNDLDLDLDLDLTLTVCIISYEKLVQREK